MITKDILCERNFEGSLVCSTIVEGYRLHRIYIGYSKKYAITHFKNNLPK